MIMKFAPSNRPNRILANCWSRYQPVTYLFTGRFHNYMWALGIRWTFSRTFYQFSGNWGNTSIWYSDQLPIQSVGTSTNLKLVSISSIIVNLEKLMPLDSLLHDWENNTLKIGQAIVIDVALFIGVQTDDSQIREDTYYRVLFFSADLQPILVTFCS